MLVRFTHLIYTYCTVILHQDATQGRYPQILRAEISQPCVEVPRSLGDMLRVTAATLDPATASSQTAAVLRLAAAAKSLGSLPTLRCQAVCEATATPGIASRSVQQLKIPHQPSQQLSPLEILSLTNLAFSGKTVRL